MIENESNPQHPESLIIPGDHPIPTNWITKQDLVYCRPALAEKIRRLETEDMQAIATKVGDAVLVTYWIAMGVILDEYLKDDKERQPKSIPTP